MGKKRRNDIFPPVVKRYFLQEERKFTSSSDWIKLLKLNQSIYDAVIRQGISFKPEFNAVNWAFDVVRLCFEILYGYCWMESHANYYKKQVSHDAQPAHVNFNVSYFADNSITRIYSCRDKLALMIWAYYCPFNPERKEEILNYYDILKRLKSPVKYGHKLKNHDDFIKFMDTLQGEEFNFIERYRHIKTHRREPRIEIYGVKPHHGWGYMIPLENQKDIELFKQELEKLYPDNQLREIVLKGCYINGILFDRKDIRYNFFSYDEVKDKINGCFSKLLKSSNGCLQILRRRSPLRNIKKRM